jgi:hypothetical protein
MTKEKPTIRRASILERHEQDGHRASGGQRQAGVGGRVTDHLLQQLGDKLGGAEDQEPDHQQHDRGDGEIALAEHPDSDHRILAAQLPWNEGGERDDAYDRRDLNDGT